MTEVETERLLLRRWQLKDLQPFALMGKDPRVMKFFPALVTEEETAAMIARINARFLENGFCFWAVERKYDGAFLGFTGLNRPAFTTPASPCVEVGWRLAFEYWGHGYATEAANGSLKYGFDVLGLPEIVAFTAVENARSRAVMDRIGMTRDLGSDFEHPNIPEGHHLRKHVLYRKKKPAKIARE